MSPAMGYTEIKDSGHPCIGLIPAHWTLSRFGRIASVKSNLVEPSSYMSYPQISPENIEKDSGVLLDWGTVEQSGVVSWNHLFFQGQIIYSKVRPALNKVVIAPFDGLCSADMYPIDTEHHSRFVMYLMLSQCFVEQVAMVTGNRVKMPKINQAELSEIIVAVPPIDEEIKIAEYLDKRCAEIDEIITEARASIEDYKQWKASVIYEAVTKGLTPGVETKYGGVDWIGTIPKHWRVGQLKRFVSIRSGITLGKKYPRDARLVEVPYLRVANVQDDHIDLSDVASISALPEEIERYALKAGELLMTEGGDRDKLGRGTIWGGEIDPCLHQNHVFAVTCNEQCLNPQFLDYLTTSKVARDYFDLTAKKTTNLASTNQSSILRFTIPVPPLEEQKQICEYLSEKTGAVNVLLEEKQALIADLEAYKKSLIYEAVTGKRKVV